MKFFDHTIYAFPGSTYPNPERTDDYISPSRDIKDPTSVDAVLKSEKKAAAKEAKKMCKKPACCTTVELVVYSLDPAGKKYMKKKGWSNGTTIKKMMCSKIGDR